MIQKPKTKEMNRERKHRAWDAKNGWMLHNVGVSGSGKCFVWEPSVNVGPVHVSMWIEYDFPLMEFTGLYDKSGKEIYEGDIIEARPEFISPVKQVVVYDVASAGYAVSLEGKGKPERFFESWVLGCSFEVIGNIHQHPHLLATTLEKQPEPPTTATTPPQTGQK